MLVAEAETGRVHFGLVGANVVHMTHRSAEEDIGYRSQGGGQLRYRSDGLALGLHRTALFGA